MNLPRDKFDAVRRNLYFIFTACMCVFAKEFDVLKCISQDLLLDFSDLLQINVYALGRAYLKLSNALHINPPALG